MPVRAAEFCAEEVLRALPRDRDTSGSASEAKDIQVVVFHSLPCGKMIMAKRGADTHDLVSSYGSANTAATHENTPIYFSIGYRPSERNGEIGVIIAVVIGFVTEVNYLVTFCDQHVCE